MKKYTIYIILVSITCFSTLLSASDDTVLYIVLDTSGSMKNKYKWVADTILSLKNASDNNPQITDSITLRSFTDKTKILIKGDEQDIVRSINSITLGGGIEDGFIPISKIANKINSGAHILLITDEDRDRVLDINTEELLGVVKDKNITIHAVLQRQFNCENNSIIGINSNFEGITEEFTYVNCTSPQLFRNRSNDDYINLVLGSYGHVWNLSKIMENHSGFGEYLAHELENIYVTSLKANIITVGFHKVENPITFDASDTVSDEGIAPVTNWAWDFDSDGIFDDFGPVVAFIFDQKGKHRITLRLSNEQSPPVIIDQIINIELSE